MASRLLRRWLNRPLQDINTLKNRQHSIAELQANFLHENLHESLKHVGDMERILTRVALRSAKTPRFNTIAFVASHTTGDCLSTKLSAN